MIYTVIYNTVIKSKYLALDIVGYQKYTNQHKAEYNQKGQYFQKITYIFLKCQGIFFYHRTHLVATLQLSSPEIL